MSPERETLYTGLSHAAWGYFFLNFDVNFGTVSVIPRFVGFLLLLSAIGKRLDAGVRRVELRLPYDKGGVLDALYREAKVEQVEYGDAILVTAVCTPKTLGRVGEYVVER